MHFPHRPLVADTIPPNITQKKTTYHVGNDDFWQRCCVMTRGQKRLRSLCRGRSAPSLSRDTGAAFPYSLPGMRSRTAAFFFSIIYLRRKKKRKKEKRDSFSYDKGLLCLNVFTHSPLEGRRSGAVQMAVLRYRGRIIFLGRACCSSSSLCICRALLLSGLSALSAVLSVCLSVCLSDSWRAVCLPVSYN